MSIPRPATAAGRFYPDDPVSLVAFVDEYLASAQAVDCPPPKALIVPHAGFLYSGAVAGSGYSCLHGRTITRVVMFGPAHRWPVSGLALPACDSFVTPLGTVPIDTEAVEQALLLEAVEVVGSAHTQEHAIEVQLPFLQQRLPEGFHLVPFVVGRATPQQVEEVMDELWGGEETLLVISSDLSHFHEYDMARQLDAATSAAIEALAPEDVHESAACGRVSIQAILAIAARRGLTARTVDQRNSGDTAGGRTEVVGYGAYVIG
ncbi:MAG TPA: AmmeMemoRadiSam system protein B [Candidatus Latescibacteria bacterium]|nr:AmmeMemoRadiSam system protein B [Candidatus Latescibacterota bacterium]HJP32493.1 AmmeMemoRadiSam system protein B [Candidatus Latescibacterota bacterium]